MSQKNNSQLLKDKEQLVATKEKLEAVKSQQPSKWTNQMQVKLDETIGEIADIDEALNEITEQNASYSPAPGTENMVHLKIVRGKRFNPNTGVEESKPFVQIFSKSEYNLFKKNATNLGYAILEVLHDSNDKSK